jgi:hypothetical protein
MQSIYLMSRQLTERFLGLADLVVAPDMGGVSWEDLDRAAEIIESGRRHMREQIPQLRILLRSPGLMHRFRRWIGPAASA